MRAARGWISAGRAQKKKWVNAAEGGKSEFFEKKKKRVQENLNVWFKGGWLFYWR